jgi:hypothetical protein
LSELVSRRKVTAGLFECRSSTQSRADASENGREASPSFLIYEEFGKPQTLCK